MTSAEREFNKAVRRLDMYLDDGEVVLNTNKMRFGNPLLNITLALSTIENYFEFSGKKGDYPYE